MGQTSNELKGPDLAVGIDVDTLQDGVPLLGHANGEAVVVVKRGGACHAVGATCTHYSGPLAEGIVVDATIRCPWHHARFDLATGAPLGGPGLGALPCFETSQEGKLLRVGVKKKPAPLKPKPSRNVERVVIIGSGTAGLVTADTLRGEGHDGPITMVGDEGATIDRPNLSKDYLAGTAPDEWMTIRDSAGLKAAGVELVEARATAIDRNNKRVSVEGKGDLGYDVLVMATGAAPIRLAIPGADGPNVHLIRTLADSRRIIAATKDAKRAVIVGGGFIGLEAAAALRSRGVDVVVILRETVPLERVLGDRLGRFVEEIHREHGVTFVRGDTASIDASHVTLADGSKHAADVVVMGVGVRPRAELAEAAGLRVDKGIVVDASLKTSDPSVYAVGDVARFPWGPAGELVRIEHWVHAQRMGFFAARHILGHAERFTMPPFFWSQHYDVPIAYVGAGAWDSCDVIGDPAKRDVLAVYRNQGRIVALASIYRDQESLRFEAALEQGGDLDLLMRAGQ